MRRSWSPPVGNAPPLAAAEGSAPPGRIQGLSRLSVSQSQAGRKDLFPIPTYLQIRPAIPGGNRPAVGCHRLVRVFLQEEKEHA
jgi:hypothetical protein